MESLIIKNYMLIPFPASNFPPIPTERNLLGFQIPSHHLNSKMVFGGWIQRGSTHETWLSCFFLSPPTPQHLKKPALWFMWPCKMALLEGGGGGKGANRKAEFVKIGQRTLCMSTQNRSCIFSPIPLSCCNC